MKITQIAPHMKLNTATRRNREDRKASEIRNQLQIISERHQFISSVTKIQHVLTNQSNMYNEQEEEYKCKE